MNRNRHSICPRMAFLFVLTMLIACSLVAQIPEPNVNMVAGTSWPFGDPFLQRQNEGSVTGGPRNYFHLLGASNDYRTVDLPGLPDGSETGDAWIGVYKSVDGGKKWWSTLLPGYPQDISPAGLASPVHGFPAAADPVVRAGNNGMFYISFIVLTRDANNPMSAVGVARYLDKNNAEAGDPWTYVNTNVTDRGTSGQFIDKPWLAVGPAAPGAAPCTVSGLTFPAQNVYLAYSVFVGNDINIRTKMMFARSTDCGATWSSPQKLSETFAINQGASIAVDQASGTVYVAWRRFKSNNDPDSIVIAKSVDRGATFTKGSVVTNIVPFEQGTSTASIRTNAYPATAMDAAGRVYIAWSQRGLGPYADARIMIMSSMDGTTWTAATQVDPLAHGGHQFMPTMAFAGGKLVVAYYDLREDNTIGIFHPLGGGQYQEDRDELGQLPGNPAGVFTPFVVDTAGNRRHTIDVRAAQSSVPMLNFASKRVSRYDFGTRKGFSATCQQLVIPAPCIEQLQVNPPNLPMFRQGTVPFFGDYLDIVGYASGAGNAPVFHAVWTDNRDVRPPADHNWTHYTPVSLATNAQSKFDPTKTVPACIEGQTGMRNQNIYTSRISEGLFAGSPGNAKQLKTSTGGLLQRAFAIFVQNARKTPTNYHLSIVQQANVTASFLQFDATATQLDIQVPARSTSTRTLFVTSADPVNNAHPTVSVTVTETNTTDLLGTTVVINPDVSNPDVSNDTLTPDVSNTEVYNPDVSNPDVSNPDVSNPDVSNPDVSNPDVSNPDVSNPDVSNPDVSNPDLANPDVSNPDVSNPDVSNPDVSNPDVSNVDVSNTSVTDTTWTAHNQGNTTTGYTNKMFGHGPPSAIKTQVIVSRIYQTPTAHGCRPGLEDHKQIIASIPNPNFDSDLTNPFPLAGDATFWLAPGDSVNVTLRVFDLNIHDAITWDPIAEGITPVIFAQAVNTVDAKNGIRTPPSTLTITTTSLPTGYSGTPYTATMVAAGGVGSRKWSMKGPSGLSIDQNSGVIGGSPTNAGDSLVTVMVTDSATSPHTASRTLKLHILPSLVINNVGVIDGVVGQRYTESASASGGTPPYSWSVQGPAGLSILPATGIMIGNFSAPLNTTFDLIVTDSAQSPNTSKKTLPIRVFPALGIQTETLPSGLVKVGYQSALTATGGLAPLSWSLDPTSGPLPSGLQLSPDGTISGVPTTSGSYPVVFTVTETSTARQTATATINIRIEVATQNITFVVQPSTTSAGQVMSPNVAVRVMDAAGAVLPGIAIDLSVGNNPGKVTFTTLHGLTNAVGVVQFGGVAIPTAGAGYTLLASAPSFGIATESSAFDVTSAIPATVTGGFGQLVAVFTSGLPDPTSWSTLNLQATFLQGQSSLRGFAFAGPSSTSVLYARLPFEGDGVNSGSLAPGQALVHITWNGGSVPDVPIQVSNTPGRPVLRTIVGLDAPPTGNNPCGGAIVSENQIVTVTPGQGIGISAYGTDTVGAVAIFRQGEFPTEVTSLCATSSVAGLVNRFTVPASLASGNVSVSILTIVNGVRSAESDSIQLTVPVITP